MRIHHVGLNCMVTLLVVGSVSVFAQDFPPRTQITHAISDIEGLEPPVIDGFLDDEAWTKSAQGPAPERCFWWVLYNFDLNRDDPAQPGVFEGDDEPMDTNDCSFRVWAMHDDEYLYIAVAVIDDGIVQRLAPDSEDGETWNEDSVEIFIDGNHSATPGRVQDNPAEYTTGGQFVLTSAGARRDKEAGDPSFGEGPDAEWFAAVFDNDDFNGFNYEFRIKLSKIGNPQKGDTIGFNVAVNDADDSAESGIRFQLRWTGEAHQESTYGDLFFGRRELTAPLIDQPVTIDGKLDEAFWASAGRGHSSAYEGAIDGTSYPRDLDDLSYDILVLHDEQFLYLAVDVTDSEVITDTLAPGTDGQYWIDDSVEVMVDGNYNRTPGYDWGFGKGTKFVVTANAGRRDRTDYIFAEDVNDGNWYAVPSLTDKGYIIEFRFLKEAILPSIDFPQIGFNIAINEDDSDPEVEKDSGNQLNWDGVSDDEQSYGILFFGGPPTAIDSWDLY